MRTKTIALEEREYISLLQNDFLSLVTRVHYELNPQIPFQYAPYIGYLASVLEECRAGKYKRCIINMPPRSLKSHLVSVCLPVWILGHDPSKHIICASYGQELADDLARKRRTIMRTDMYRKIFPTRLGDQQAVHNLLTTEQGSCRATSVGGTLTGLGADCLILDDVQKPDDVLSTVQRRTTNQWFDNTLMSRLNDPEKGIIIIVMQRLHQHDLVGHVLEQSGWKVLCLPAVAEADERYEFTNVLGTHRFVRSKGEVLHPQRVSKETLWKTRDQIGQYNFSAQYQQRPIPLEGNLVRPEWLQRFKVSEFQPGHGTIYQAWDTAMKSGELNDYSVCVTFSESNHHFFLLDVFRRKLDYPDLKEAVVAQHDRFKPDHIIIEDKASGTQLIQELETVGLFGVSGVSSNVEKIMRFRAVTPLFASGRIHVPTEAPWLADYLDELLTFPSSRHDDQVDATAHVTCH